MAQQLAEAICALAAPPVPPADCLVTNSLGAVLLLRLRPHASGLKVAVFSAASLAYAIVGKRAEEYFARQHSLRATAVELPALGHYAQPLLAPLPADARPVPLPGIPPPPPVGYPPLPEYPAKSPLATGVPTNGGGGDVEALRREWEQEKWRREMLQHMEMKAAIAAANTKATLSAAAAHGAGPNVINNNNSVGGGRGGAAIRERYCGPI
ncbi:hypothetical protein ABPG75_000294 [Micractinium tetrahymenae]